MTLEDLPEGGLVQITTKWIIKTVACWKLLVMPAGETEMTIVTGAIYVILGHELCFNLAMITKNVRDNAAAVC